MKQIAHLAFIWACILLGMTVAQWRANHHGVSAWLGPTYNDHLGAEYDCIARAIRSGRGFADPFRVASGPTAWMPPLLPYLQAAIYWIASDDRDSVISAVLLLKALVLLSTGMIVMTEARRLRLAWLGYVLFPIALMANFSQLFQVTHDEWLLLLSVNALWLGMTHLWWPKSAMNGAQELDLRQRIMWPILWGLFGGVLALASPILGGVWAVVTTLPILFGLWSSSLHSCSVFWRAWAVAALTSIAVVTPWTVRNRIVFDRWLPIKSNGAFELWQSQCLGDHGLVDQAVTVLHPYPSHSLARQHYLEVGEIAFIDEKWPEIKASIRSNPSELLRRIANRAAAALFDYRAYSPRHEQQIWPMRFKRLVFPFPFLAALLLLVVAICSLQSPLQVSAALWIYFLTLLPYILVSYYDRYAAPLLTIKMLLVLYAVANLFPQPDPSKPTCDCKTPTAN